MGDCERAHANRPHFCYSGTFKVLWYSGTLRIAHVLASFLGEAAIQTLDMQRWSNGERLDTSENSVKTAEGRESNCRTVVWSLKTFAGIVLVLNI